MGEGAEGAFGLFGIGFDDVEHFERLVEKFLVGAPFENGVEGDQIWLEEYEVGLGGLLLTAEEDVLDELDGAVDLVAADAGVDEDVEEDFAAERFAVLIEVV